MRSSKSSCRDETLSGILSRLAESPDDKSAWSELYLELWPFVLAISSRLERDSEDLTQEVFLRLLKTAERRPRLIANLTNPHAFRGFLIKMCRNLHVDHVRRKASLSPHRTLDEDIETLADTSVTLDETVILEEVYHRLFEQLNESEKEVFKLLADGCTPAEIANVLGLTGTVARQKIHRLRTKISGVYKGLMIPLN